MGYYEKTYTNLVSSGTFKYRDLDSNIFINTVAMHDTIGFPAGLDTIKKSVPLQINWVGSPLVEKETVTAWVNSNIEGDSRLVSTNNVGATNLIFPLNQLTQLGTGPHGTLLMERLYSPAITEATSAGGSVNLKYIPKNKTGLEIVP